MNLPTPSINNTRFFDKKNWILLALTLPAIIWAAYRLYAVEMTHDEAWSFHMAYRQLYDNMLQTANNHWVNTLFIFLESKILGVEIWKIRLHTFVGFLFFLYFLLKICIRIPNRWAAYSTILLVAYNTYTLDFFSLARGYGLGLAFGMAAVYYILYKDKSVKIRLLIYLLLCLSAGSVYTQLYLLFAYGVYEFLIVFKGNIFSAKKFIEYIKPFWLPAIFLFYAVKNILYIKKSGDLNEGLSNGFFQDSLGVFFERAYEPLLSNQVATIIGVLVFAVIVICLLLPKRFFITTHCKKLAWILFFGFVMHEFFFYMLHTPYPFGRTALYYIVPLLLLAGLFLGELSKKTLPNVFQISLLALIACIQIGYMAFIKNPRTTNEWWMGQGVSQAIQKIKTTEDRNLQDLSLLYYEGHNGVFLNYYNLINGQDIFNRVNRIHLFHLDEDFNAIEKNPNQFDYILLPDYDSILNSSIQFQAYDSVQYYADMKTWLLKKKQ